MLDRKLYEQFDDKPDIHHRFEVGLVNKFVLNKKVLDVGCWTGQFLSLIEDKCRTYGIDPGRQAIKFAKAKRKGEFSVGSALKLPYKDNSFDVVTMWDVIEHLPIKTEPRALREAHRVLKRNGIFAISTVTMHPISIILDPAYFLLGHRHYSKSQLYALLEKAGFSVDKVIYSGGLWSLIRENINLLTKHILGKNIYVRYLEEKVKQEYKGKGFYQIHIFARKK